MSNWREAVEEMNRRTKADGWISSYAPQLSCPQCPNIGLMLTTIYGQTKAHCGSCGHSWVVA